MNSTRSPLTLAHVALGCLVILSSACDPSGQNLPAAPTATVAPTAPGVPTVTLSGTIVEGISGQPVAGVSVSIWPRTRPTGRQWSWFPQSVKSDASGAYRITGIDADFGSFWVSTWYADGKYVQQCATTATLTADEHLDLMLTAREHLATGLARQPPRAPGTRTLSGVVYEITDTGRQPVENATVGFEGFMDFVTAWTFTDANGRYLLCNLPDTRLSVFVTRQPAVFPTPTTYSIVEAGSDTTLDLEVER